MLENSRVENQVEESQLEPEKFRCQNCKEETVLREKGLCGYCQQPEFIDYDLYNHKFDGVWPSWRRELKINV